MVDIGRDEGDYHFQWPGVLLPSAPDVHRSHQSVVPEVSSRDDCEGPIPISKCVVLHVNDVTCIDRSASVPPLGSVGTGAEIRVQPSPPQVSGETIDQGPPSEVGDAGRGQDLAKELL